MDKIALFDLDDTLLDLKDALYVTLKKEYGDRIHHWCLWGSFNVDEQIGITVEELKEVCVKHEVFRFMKPNLFAPYILKDLRNRGYHIIILTAREGFVPDAFNQTASYLKQNDLYYDKLIVTGHGENKMDALGDYDRIEFAIDDQEKNCIDFADSGKIDHVFLAALPHNKNCNRFIRLHNLYQVYKHLGLD